MHQDSCIFCKIVKGEIPSVKVFENEHVLAFLDISLVSKGHTLVIPKNHEKDIYELQEETASELFKAVPMIANGIKKSFQPVGLNILNNNEAPAGQSVFHYHLHLIPRYDDTDGFDPTWQPKTNHFSDDELEEIASTISNNIV